MQFWCRFIAIILVSNSLAYAQSRRNINKKLVQDMKAIMNEKVNPCTDFYQYACGHWDYELPYNRDYIHIVGSLEYKINLKLKEILEKKRINHKNQDFNDIYNKVRLYYESCKKQTEFNVAEYLKVFKPIENEEWPKEGEHWQPPTKNWNIWLTLAKLQKIGLNGFLLTMDIRRFNSTHLYIYLNKMENFNYTSYEQRILDDVDYINDTETYLVYRKVENFLNKLFQLKKRHQGNSNVYREMSTTELESLVKNIDFETFFSSLWGRDFYKNLPLKVANVDYFRDLSNLLQETSNSVFMHALKLRFLSFMEREMPSTTQSLSCMQHLRGLMPLALDYIYEKESYQFIRKTSNLLIFQLFKNMKEKLFALIAKHSEELSLGEYNFLKQKLADMKLNIGNMPLMANETFYHKYFHTWQVNEQQFYWNHIKALNHFYTDRFNLLKQPWHKPLHTYFPWPFATPAYQPTTNLLVIPYAYLQYPIFHPKFHNLFLYAELGNTLGHEMLHAFDTNGLLYDSLGNPSSLFLRPLLKRTSFMGSLKCFEKFQAFCLNELIADISGFRLAYDLYFQNTNGRRKYHGTTEFSNKQLFFIKFAQFFCSSSSFHDETHDSPSYRVRKVVTSHPEFEHIFKCHKDLHKREVQKCNLW